MARLPHEEVHMKTLVATGATANRFRKSIHLAFQVQANMLEAEGVAPEEIAASFAIACLSTFTRTTFVGGSDQLKEQAFNELLEASQRITARLLAAEGN